MVSILEKTQEFVLKTTNEKLPSGFLYHNYNHTERVVKHVKELIEAENINDTDSEILEIAAWFHDIGHIHGCEKHEEKSAQIAHDFLTNENYSEDKIKLIEDCIKATSMHIKPVTQLQKMLCDADFSHFASKNYEEISDLLREELKQLNINTYSDREWVMENIKMFNEHHRFYTPHAIKDWQPKKNKNLLNLNKKLSKIIEKENEKAAKKSDRKRKKNKDERPERGIETLFRVTMKNHLDLSSIADTKANILLSVNAIIISLALAQLLPKLDNPSNSHLIIPTLIFVTFSLISMGLSVVATRPNITSGQFTKKDVEDKKVNLLFFGNFHKMKLDEFEWAISEVMKDKDYLYGSLTKDLYFLGKVLERKYRILRITYSIFLFGIIVSVIAFGFAFKISGF